MGQFCHQKRPEKYENSFKKSHEVKIDPISQKTYKIFKKLIKDLGSRKTD